MTAGLAGMIAFAAVQHLVVTTRNVFYSCGTAHPVRVSGTHFNFGIADHHVVSEAIVVPPSSS